MNEPFFIGIPLIARAAAHEWSVVEHLFGLTLRSILAQDDRDLRVLLAAHDLPQPWRAVDRDPRFTHLPADWVPEPPTGANDDGGRKKWLIKQQVRKAGGGLLMFLDADDWIASDLVRRAREAVLPGQVGAVISVGYAIDYRSGRTMPFPVASFADEFYQLCGSSTVGRVVPGAGDPLRADPHAELGSHHQWSQAAAQRGVTLARIDTAGAYLIGTGNNHSERESPVEWWRREITSVVRRHGEPLTGSLARRFGQEPDVLSAAAPRTEPGASLCDEKRF